MSQSLSTTRWPPFHPPNPNLLILQGLSSLSLLPSPSSIFVVPIHPYLDLVSPWLPLLPFLPLPRAISPPETYSFSRLILLLPWSFSPLRTSFLPSFCVFLRAVSYMRHLSTSFSLSFQPHLVSPWRSPSSVFLLYFTSLLPVPDASLHLFSLILASSRFLMFSLSLEYLSLPLLRFLSFSFIN